CRDDYGAHSQDTSAWSGVHYFASREHDEKGPLTWPEGNGWILQRLLKKLARYVHTDALVYRIARDGRKLRVLTPTTEYIAEKVILPAPRVLANSLLEDP